MKIVIIGVGQTMRGDDGAGPAAVKTWVERYPQTLGATQIQTEIEELPGLNLLSLLQGSDAAIIVDAVQSKNKPGTLHLIQDDSQFLSRDKAQSAHNLGVQETLALARLLLFEDLPKLITIIGIEVENVALGENLSIDVKNVIPKAADLIEKQLQSLLHHIPE